MIKPFELGLIAVLRHLKDVWIDRPGSLFSKAGDVQLLLLS